MNRKVLLIDCDGVLTDGRLTIDHTGEKQFKQFHTRDVRAIRELVYNGWEVYICSVDDWEGIHHFAGKVGAEVITTRDKSSLISQFPEYVAVGDDAWDFSLLFQAAEAYTPYDADPRLFDIEGVVRLDTKGGEGVMAELVRRLI